ncbi:MAG: HK97 family phage prohead protease [Treponema sp.]|jgi:HK97 family phage prohead protease|nr:HK97 family phage prohead protease [Treponema sp.]
MIVRIKSGEYQRASASVLLDFLGVRKEATGLLKVSGDVELIAPIQIRNEELEKRKEKTIGGISWTFSTFDLDRYGERIDPLGWDFSQYVKNPVIEWAHCFHIPAIGKAENIHVDENGLHGVIVFNDKSFDPFGWSIGERVKAGVIRAGSVGFRVMEIEIPDKETAKDGTSLIFRKQELLEFSICNVPANPFALSKMRNEELGMSNEELGMNCQSGPNASLFWGSLINNL